MQRLVFPNYLYLTGKQMARAVRWSERIVMTATERLDPDNRTPFIFHIKMDGCGKEEIWITYGDRRCTLTDPETEGMNSA